MSKATKIRRRKCQKCGAIRQIIGGEKSIIKIGDEICKNCKKWLGKYSFSFTIRGTIQADSFQEAKKKVNSMLAKKCLDFQVDM